jgi:hypothetical protein
MNKLLSHVADPSPVLLALYVAEVADEVEQ